MKQRTIAVPDHPVSPVVVKISMACFSPFSILHYLIGFVVRVATMLMCRYFAMLRCNMSMSGQNHKVTSLEDVDKSKCDELTRYTQIMMHGI